MSGWRNDRRQQSVINIQSDAVKDDEFRMGNFIRQIERLLTIFDVTTVVRPTGDPPGPLRQPAILRASVATSYQSDNSPPNLFQRDLYTI